MRILFIHTIGKKKYGGGERWVVRAAEGLKQAGHLVTVGGWKGSLLLKEAERCGLQTACFNIFSDISPWQALRIAWFIRKNNIDAVITKRRDLAVAGMGAKIAGCKNVLVRSGSPPQRSIAKHIFLMKNLSLGIITNTRSIQEFYHQRGLDKPGFVRVIYNGLQLHDDIPSYNFADRFPGRRIILSVGRVVHAKGYFYLLDALALLKEQLKEIMVFVIGDGKDLSKLQKRALELGVSDMIWFEGYQPNPVPYIKGCELFLHPSLYEGMPNAPMEALAYGKPVIMTRVNGADELTGNGEYAQLIREADPSAIASAVMEFFSNPLPLKEKGLAAKEYVRKRFTKEVMIKEIEAFLMDTENIR